MSLMNGGLAMELVKDVGGRPQKSLSEKQTGRVKVFVSVSAKEHTASYCVF